MVQILPKNSFEERMQLLIDQAGSQEKLGDMCGISGVMIGKYALGKSEPSRSKLIAIANAAGVDVGWLATGAGEMKRGEISGQVANGNGILQGHHVSAEEIHIDVHAADPLNQAFLKDWLSLNDVDRMEIWLTVKKEIAKGKV